MADRREAVPGPDMRFLDVGRTDPEMQQRLGDWTQAVTERAPYSENIEDRRAGEGVVGRYLGPVVDKARNFWSNITEARYQQGGEVAREPTHVSANRANLRMIAHHARRDPQRAKHLLQGLRRQHNGLRAMATAALARSHGLREGSGRHELAHGHDAHALHLLNMAHAQVPDNAEMHFSQHGDHGFNARVNRNGRTTDFPLNRNQLMQFSHGLAGQFDHVMRNGVEKNLAILSRRPRRPQVLGYQGGGEVEDDREWDPQTQSYFPLGTPPTRSRDEQDVRKVYDDTLRDAGLLEQRTRELQRAGVPVTPTEPARMPEAVQPGGALERAIEERHQRYFAEPARGYLQYLLHPTTENSASAAQLQQAHNEVPRDIEYGPAAYGAELRTTEPTTTGAAERPAERDYLSTPILTGEGALARGEVQGPREPYKGFEAAAWPSPPVLRPLYEPEARPAPGSPAAGEQPSLGPVTQARLRADPEYSQAMIRAGHTGAATPEEVTRALGPAAGESVRRALAGQQPQPQAAGTLPTEIPAGYRTEPGTVERFKEMWQRGRVLDPRQPAAERGAQIDEPDFIRGLQNQAREQAQKQNSSAWEKVANSLEPMIGNAQRGGIGSSQEEQAYLARLYKQLNPDARVMPDVVPLRAQPADPAVIQQAQERYPNDPRAREAFIDANWNVTSPELRVQREATRRGEDRQATITRLEAEAERVGQQRGGSGRATELQRTADKMRMEDAGIQIGRRGMTVREGLSDDQVVKAFTQARTIYERNLRTNPQTAEQFKPSPEFEERYNRITKGGGRGGGIPTISTKEERDKLPKGTQYYDPNGILRVT